MVPKEKAKEIVGKMCGNDCTETNIERMIKPALIAVDEIIKACTNVSGHTMNKDYWNEVKSELERLK